MVRAAYIPERGDFVWTDFSPRRGHEQRGRRPALVLSPRYFNERSGLMLCCPTTTREKGYPFEVPFVTKTVAGVVSADQANTLDWEERRVTLAGKASETVVDQVGSLVAQIAQGK